MLGEIITVIVITLLITVTVWAIKSSNTRLGTSQSASPVNTAPTTASTSHWTELATWGPAFLVYWIIMAIIILILLRGCLLPELGIQTLAEEAEDEPDVVLVNQTPRLSLSDLDLALNRQGVWEVWSGEVRARTNGDKCKSFGVVIPPRQPLGQVTVTVHGDGEAYMVDQALYKEPQSIPFLRQHTWNGNSDTAYIYRLGTQGYPHTEVWGNKDREVGVYYIQSEGERIFPIRHEYKQPIKQYLVHINSQDAASFTLPASDWKDVWIVAIDDLSYLSAFNGQAVSPAGVSWDTIAMHMSNHYHDLGIEDFAERAAHELAATQQLIHPQIGYQGLYYQIQGSPAVPLLESKEFSFENSEKGLRITIGLNVPRSATRVTPARVLVGISQ